MARSLAADFELSLFLPFCADFCLMREHPLGELAMASSMPGQVLWIWMWLGLFCLSSAHRVGPAWTDEQSTYGSVIAFDVH
jgi:hypothetical protein